jgi:hypothetical protein
MRCPAAHPLAWSAGRQTTCTKGGRDVAVPAKDVVWVGVGVGSGVGGADDQGCIGFHGRVGPLNVDGVCPAACPPQPPRLACSCPSSYSYCWPNECQQNGARRCPLAAGRTA